MRTINSIFLIGTLLSLLACQEKNPLEIKTAFDPPSHFPEDYYQNDKNPLTAAGIALGKSLFYDPVLSRDSSISCASCHDQRYAFSDRGKQFSIGIDQITGTRNSPALFNLAWFKHFMWDGGINHIEVMTFGPLNNPTEMDADLREVLKSLNASPQYAAEFEKVFDIKQITDLEFFYAMSQFMAALISAKSPYDAMVRGTYSFSPDEQKGYTLYQEHCGSCHVEPLFTDGSFQNNGLDTVFTDPGRTRITLDNNDLGKFKVPSLRNLSFTAPYMHDGRFIDMNQVLDHYIHEVKPSATVSPLVQDIKLNSTERMQLLAFLKTLDDDDFVQDPRWSRP